MSNVRIQKKTRKNESFLCGANGSNTDSFHFPVFFLLKTIQPRKAILKTLKF